MNREEFRAIYSPNKLFKYSVYEERCHIGTAPTLRQIAKNYGNIEATQFVVGCLSILEANIGAKYKLQPHQRATVAWLCITQYGSLKATEIMLWVVKCLSGQYGKFYNTLDPMDIICTIRQWKAECDRIKGEHLYKLAIEREKSEIRERYGKDEDGIPFDEAVRRGLIKAKFTDYLPKTMKDEK